MPVTEMREVFSGNITHNLWRMARVAEIYSHVWEPQKIGITKARQLIEPLKAGLARLNADPDKFKKLNPKNCCGSYEGLVEFVRSYIEACERYPDATVTANR
jgi:hypothetical protein